MTKNADGAEEKTQWHRMPSFNSVLQAIMVHLPETHRSIISRECVHEDIKQQIRHEHEKENCNKHASP